MSARMRAVYRHGAFFPEEPCDLPENAEVDLLVEPSRAEPSRAIDSRERARLLREPTDSRRDPGAGDTFAQRWRGAFRPSSRDDERYRRLAGKYL